MTTDKAKIENRIKALEHQISHVGSLGFTITMGHQSGIKKEIVQTQKELLTKEKDTGGANEQFGGIKKTSTTY